MQENCLFCQPKTHWRENVYETKNFKVRIGIGIVTAGHCMIITKDHYSCIGAIPDELDNEYLDLKAHLTKVVTQKFAKPFLKEYGVFNQSVPHAHTHFIPLQSSQYKKFTFLNDVIIPAIKEFDIPHEITDLKGLKEIYKEDGGYATIEEDGQFYVLRPKAIKIKGNIYDYIGYRKFFTKLGLKGVSSWKNMTEEDKVLDNLKIEGTRVVGEVLRSSK